MSTEIPRHELLLKLLKMTTSTNDAEALVAMRKANALLASAGWTWDRLLEGKITVVGDPFGGLQRPRQHEAPHDAYNPPATPRAPPAPARPAPNHPARAQAAQAQANAYAAAKPRARAPRPPINYSDLFGST